MAERSKVDAFATAMLEVARVSGQLSGVEDDLFRFARTFEGSDDLRMALTDPQLPIERRISVIEQLMGDKALPDEHRARRRWWSRPARSAELPAIVGRFVELAASERDREVAEVRSAIPLDDAQIARLAEALGKATGKTIEVKVIVDPTVLGGIVARVGDTVIDGTVRHRIDEMKEQL